MTDDAPFGSLHEHWHNNETPDVLTAAIARVREMFGLTETTDMTTSTLTREISPANEREDAHMMSETFAPVPTPYAPAEGFQCGAIRRAVDAAHDREGLLTRFNRVTPQVVVAKRTSRVRREGTVSDDAPTLRQMQVLARIVAGDSQDEAADALGISRSTCNRHLMALRRRWRVTTTAGLIGQAVARGYLAIAEAA